MHKVQEIVYFAEDSFMKSRLSALSKLASLIFTCEALNPAGDQGDASRPLGTPSKRFPVAELRGICSVIKLMNVPMKFI